MFLPLIKTRRRQESHTPHSVELSISSARLVRYVFIFCVVAEIGFVLLDYHVNFGRLTDIGAIRRLTNIAREDGLASWFGTAQTLLAALTLWLIYVVVANQQTLRWRRIGWLVLALLFTYMTVDDGAQLHERLGTTYRVIRERADPSSLEFFPSYTWQLLFLPAFGALGLFTLAFLWHELTASYSKVLIVTAIACFVMAVGLDFVEGLDRDHRWNLYTTISERYDLAAFTTVRFGQSPYGTLRHFSRSIEEFLEMLANTILWVLFLQQLTVVASDLRVRFTGASRAG